MLPPILEVFVVWHPQDSRGAGLAEAIFRHFMHGPTFMGNPLACAIANASIQLLLAQDWRSTIARIERALTLGLAPCRVLPEVAEVRVLGAIGVVEMTQPVRMRELQQRLVEQGIWVRPFGRLVYLMPPYIMSDEDLATLCQGVVAVLGTPGDSAR